jgi:hypothetical protein
MASIFKMIAESLRSFIDFISDAILVLDNALKKSRLGLERQGKT